jgi:cytidine deaminase
MNAVKEADAVLSFIRNSPTKQRARGGRFSGSGDPRSAVARANEALSKLRTTSASSLAPAQAVQLGGSGGTGGGGSGSGGVVGGGVVDGAAAQARANALREQRRRAANEDEARDRYREHFRGLQASGDSGLSKLEELINAALAARDKSTSAGERRGAALLGASGAVFTGCTIDSGAHGAGAMSSSFLSSSGGMGGIGFSHAEGGCVGAETTAMLKALGEGERVFDALVLCGEEEGQYPMPSGTSRQQLAEHGDFVLYLVRPDLMYRQVSTHELYPMQLQGISAEEGASVLAGRAAERGGAADGGIAGSEADNVRTRMVDDWSVADVAHWLAVEVSMPQYKYAFADGSVDGAMLLQLQDRDLAHLLQVASSLHRRTILAAIDRLRVRQCYEDGALDHTQLEQYLAILERERIGQIAALKSAFDAVDERDANSCGRLSLHQLRAVLQEVQAAVAADCSLDHGTSAESAAKSCAALLASVLREWERQAARGGGDGGGDFHDDSMADPAHSSTSFSQLALACMQQAAQLRKVAAAEGYPETGGAPDGASALKLQQGEAGMREDASPHAARLKMLKRQGHVSLRERTSIGAQHERTMSLSPERRRVRHAQHLDSQLQQHPREPKTPLQRVAESMEQRTGWAGGTSRPRTAPHASRKSTTRHSRSSASPVRARHAGGEQPQGGVAQLKKSKDIFDRFTGRRNPPMLSSLEVAQALTELEHTAPRDVVLAYLEQRGYGTRQTDYDVDFFEFLRAIAALSAPRDDGADGNYTETRPAPRTALTKHRHRPRPREAAADEYGRESVPMSAAGRRPRPRPARTRHHGRARHADSDDLLSSSLVVRSAGDRGGGGWSGPAGVTALTTAGVAAAAAAAAAAATAAAIAAVVVAAAAAAAAVI